MRWQLLLGCLATTIASVKSKATRAEVNIVPQGSAAHNNAAEQKPASGGADLDDPSQMKVGVSSSSSAYLQVLVPFLKRYPNTINALLSVLGIYHEG